MRRVLVVGFGKFGQPALPKIRRRWPKTGIWIIDKDPAHLTAALEIPAVRVLQDGVDFLWEQREQLEDGDWIIPTVPLHLAGEWLRRILIQNQSVRKITPPAQLGEGLPWALRSKKNLYVSFADFECPENCPSPKGFCFYTREKRPHRLGDVLAGRSVAQGTLHIIPSRQLAPGLGGFQFEKLHKLESLVHTWKPPVYLATACPCHGVITGFTW